MITQVVYLRILLVFLYYISPKLTVISILIIKILLESNFDSDSIQKFLLFSLSVFNLYILISSIINKYTALPPILSIILLILFIPTISIWGYYFISHSFFSTDTLLALLQTNIAESKEYLQMNTNISYYFIIILLVSLLWIISLRIQKLKLNFNKKHSKIIVAILILIDIITLYKYKENLLTDIYLKTHTYIEKYQDFEQKKSQRKHNLTTNLNVISSNSKGIYVLVIGESENRTHMSAYNYNRNTTPWLNDMRNNSNFLIFSNAYSCHTHTVQTLTYSLTAKNQYNDLDLSSTPSLLEVAEAAGFDTVWLSNQVQYSAWDTPITIIASEANQQDWINKTVGEQTKTDYYDIKLLDSLNKIQLSDKMLIIIHLMGNHGKYTERYPKDFDIYTSGDNIDTYDNSVLYNDYVMHDIYNKVSTLPNFKSLVYFSDHSEDIVHSTHDSSKFIPEMTYIPFYMYFSDDYIKEHSSIFNTLKANQNSYFTNDLIFNAMLGIMNIQISNINEPKNNITSPNYDSTPTRFKTLYGKKSIIDLK